MLENALMISQIVYNFTPVMLFGFAGFVVYNFFNTFKD